MVSAARSPSSGGVARIDARRSARVSHSFDYRGAPTCRCCTGIDLDIGRGEFVALLGPSGCGKSTLLRLVAGLEPPSEGEILVRRRADPRARIRRGVMVLQDPTLFPWRKRRDNVALGLEARGVLRARARARRRDAATRRALATFANAYPHQLSGGMAQRVALARALVNDPELLILDEPLGKLDSLTRLTMQGEIVNLWRRAGFTALLVTHDIEEALADGDARHRAQRTPGRDQGRHSPRQALSAPSRRPRARGEAP